MANSLLDRYAQQAVVPANGSPVPGAGAEFAEALLGVRNDQVGEVALCFCYGGFQAAWVMSMVQFMGADRDLKRIGAVITGAGLYIDETRNSVVRQFLTTKCKWLLFMDTDIGFPADGLEQLLAATNDGERRVVAANYYAYYPGDNKSTWMVFSEHDHGLHACRRTPSSGIHKIEACGMGFTLIHRRVLEDIAELRKGDDDPWMWFGRDIVEVNGKTERTGEDISFCLRAQRAGHYIWGLADLVVEHFKVQPVQTTSLILDENGVAA